MAFQMWTRMVTAAEQGAQRAWEVEPAREEVGKAKVHHPDPVAPAETLMILAIGPVNSVPLQI